MKETRLLLLLSMLVGATLTGCPLTQDIEVGDMPDADPLPECRGDDACAEGERCVEGECVAGCFCPRIVAPVCGVDGITYGNECEAGCAGVAVEHAGECREPEPEPEPGPCGEDECGPSPFQREPCPDGGAPPQMCVRGEDGACGWQLGECPDVCACPEVFAPVCGADGETYGNACEARCAGVEVAHEGECRQPPRECRPVECGPGPRVEPCPDGDPPPMVCEANDAGECAWTVGECRDCACGEIFAPVCGADGATYPNACEARCAGVDVVHEGECREPGECREDECGPSPFQQRLCPDGSPPPQMCVRSADGACGWQIGACPDDPGPCGEDECGPSPFQREPCPDGNPPPQMCVRSADGVCGWQLGECPGQCVCPRVIDPVCGADGVTYQNACLANCAGVRVVHAGECRGGGECAEDECGPAAFLVALCPDGTPPPQVCERAADGVCGWRIGDCPDPPVECRPAECGPAPGAPNFQCPDGSLGGPICERDAAGRCGWQFRECPDDCACFDLWAPVCGVDGMTYGNDCEAQCAGVRVAHEGECGAVGECAEDACGPSPFFVAACPDGSIPPQACVVGADGVCRWQVGECPPVRDCDIDACGPPPPVAPCPDGNGPTIECAPNADGVCGWQIGRCEEVCVCPDVWQPVCGADGVTYGNACEARCAGVAVVADGECRGGGECAPDACGPAPFLVAPCPNGDVPPQQCLPAADGVCRWQIGECPPVDRCAPDACGAPPPVAACPDGNGPTVECAPNANGVCAWEIGRCDDCVCLDVWQPVCGADGVTYGNACEARCAGVEPVANGECGADLCALPPEPGPCEAAIRRWYHDPAVGQCQVFVWGGCGGNANNFATADACEAACGRGGAAECDADACGPAPRPLPCDDGSAPRQACLADAAGQCGWITECGAADLPR